MKVKCKWEALIAGSACFILGVFLSLSFSGAEERFPKEMELLEIVGTLEWVDSGRYGIRFGIKEMPLRFNYSSKGGRSDHVLRELMRSGGREIHVRYEPVESISGFFDVWELSVDQRAVRAYSEVVRGWSKNAKIGLGVGVVFIIYSISMLVLFGLSCIDAKKSGAIR